MVQCAPLFACNLEPADLMNAPDKPRSDVSVANVESGGFQVNVFGFHFTAAVHLG
jgi:hypothetical protein